MGRKTAVRNSDLLIEIGCEDLPARYVETLATALATGIVDGLTTRGIGHQQSWRAYATPRRLAVIVAKVAPAQADREIERKGPKLVAAMKDGGPTAAGLGFAKSCGVKFSELAQENGQLVYRGTLKGRTTEACLPEIFDETLKSMDALVPKRMRWGTGDETFVRPVQWLVALYGSKTVPIRHFGLQSGNRTYGHRFHAPRAITLRSPAEYEKRLKAAKVWADFDSRREEIRRKVEAEAKKLKGLPDLNAALLEEVTALVEWPVVISGRIEASFMSLPREVIIATIEHNQRYFPVLTKPGKLLPHFITVSNIQSRHKTEVVSGNERVVRPRLSDALFFWDQDRKTPLSALVESLDKVSFHQKLGSMGDKRRRIEAISAEIAELCDLPADTVRRAAELCKADLVTRMVFEFPELQGIMGGYYARSSGETDEVATAIREHYRPIQSGGPIPVSAAGRILALADKLDSLAGIFAVGQKPTASKDPFALRRAAMGVLRILIEGELDLDLKALLDIAVRHQPAAKDADALVKELLQFHWDRLRAFYTEAGVAVEVFESVIAVAAEYAKPFDLHCRIKALQSVRSSSEFKRLAEAHKRIRNILRQARERSEIIEGSIDRSIAEPVERDLIDAVARLRKSDAFLGFGGGESAVNDSAWKTRSYTKTFNKLSGLQAPVDAFFDEVMVMAEDPAVRRNRLALLSELDGLCRSVADISCLPG